MKKRILLNAVLLLAVLIPSFAFGQGQGGDEAVMGLPVLEVRLESSIDSLFFVGNDYLPNRITATVWVKNVSTDTAIARDVVADIVKDTRFIIPDGEAASKLVAALLLPGDEASVTFELVVAKERNSDGYDKISVLVKSSNAYPKTAEYDIWVQREFFPNLVITNQVHPAQIVFDDATDLFNPDPFDVSVTVWNNGEGAAENVYMLFTGVKYVSVYELDNARKDIGTILPNDSVTVTFKFRPARRTFDTTVHIRFQTHGVGGYLRKNYVSFDSSAIFLPQAKQAEYQVLCNVVQPFIEFKDHKYTPDPFDYTVQVTNIGTAAGKNVEARITYTGLGLAPGETGIRLIGDMPTSGPGSTVNLTFQLRAINSFVRDTLKVCVYVSDAFDNQASCCDSVVVDSIRSACFDVTCAAPDTIYADTQAGIYTNSPFDVTFTVCNVCSDYADSLKATMIIQLPYLQALPGFPIVMEKALLTPTDTLGVDSCFTFTWTLEALPVSVGTSVPIRFTVQALNAEPKDCEVNVFVQRLDAPNLDVTCETIPGDSLRFDPRTGGYFPPFVIFRATVTNVGGGIAKNVTATLSQPPRTMLNGGEVATKLVSPKDLGPNESGIVEWVTIPVTRTDFGMPTIYRVDIASENVIERPWCTDTIFIPALPKTVAFSIPQNNIGYTGQIILVPIYIDDPTDKDIKKIEIKLNYNIDDNRNRRSFDIVEFLNVVQLNSLSAGWTLLNQSVNGTNDGLSFAIESATPLAYPSNVAPEFIPPLIWLRFRAQFGSRPDELDIERTPLLWPDPSIIQSEVLVNDGSIFPLVTDGEIWVSGDCLRPLTASPNYIIFNRPNPFNPSTTFEYRIPVDEHVKIVVFDALGRQVKILVDEMKTAGNHSLVFDAKDLPSGIYFYRLETLNFSQMKKMVVSK